MEIDDPPKDPFHRVYRGLREQLANAELRPGSQIRVDEAARRYAISHTPVREALARLSGERLVRGCRRQGYFVPRYDTAELIDLYDMLELYLLAAIREDLQVGRSEDDRQAPQSYPRAFMTILASNHNGFLREAGALVIERLATARRAERTIETLKADEPASLALLGRAGEAAQTQAIRLYHQARRSIAARIAAALAPEANEYFPDII